MFENSLVNVRLPSHQMTRLNINEMELDPERIYQMKNKDGTSLILRPYTQTNDLTSLFTSKPKHQLDINLYDQDLGYKLLNVMDYLKSDIDNSGSHCFYTMEDPRQNGQFISIPCNLNGGWKKGKIFNIDIEMKILKNTDNQVIGISLRLDKINHRIESTQFINNLIRGNVAEVLMIQ